MAQIHWNIHSSALYNWRGAWKLSPKWLSMFSPNLCLCYKQVKGQLNENLTTDQMSLGAFLHTPLPIKSYSVEMLPTKPWLPWYDDQGSRLIFLIVFFFSFFGSWLFQLEGCMELSPSNWLSVQSNALFVLQAGKGPIEWESNSWSALTWGFLAFIPSEIKSYYKGSPSLVYHRVMQLFTTLIIYNCSRNSGNWHLGLFSKPLLIVIIIIVTVPCSWACRAWFFIVVIAAVRRATAVWENGVAG